MSLILLQAQWEELSRVGGYMGWATCLIALIVAQFLNQQQSR